MIRSGLFVIALCSAACGDTAKKKSEAPPADDAKMAEMQGHDAGPVSPIPARTHQLVVAIADSWETPVATLHRFARAKSSEPWHEIGEPHPVSLGRSGLAWGMGLHGAGRPDNAAGAGPLKREGDGRAAAGVFRIGRSLGYAKNPPPGSGMPYTQSTATWRCVDDPRSSRYNDIFDTADVSRDWRSAELMKRADHVYELVIDIEHNWPDPVPGAGSCIFFHVWRSPKRPTAGCTAMPRRAIEDLITWIEPSRHPVYVLLPRDRYDVLKERWQLPSIKP